MSKSGCPLPACSLQGRAAAGSAKRCGRLVPPGLSAGAENSSLDTLSGANHREDSSVERPQRPPSNEPFEHDGRMCLTPCFSGLKITAR